MPRSADSLAPVEAAAAPRIALVSDGGDGHARSLARALAARGARVAPMRLSRCRFETTSPSGLHLDGFGTALPDAVFVRTLAGGSFQAVTMRLGLLHALRESGVIVWNDARAIERCVDKSATSFLLARAGLPTPPTWTLASEADARLLVQRELRRGPLVLKPLFGSQGRGLRLVARDDDLPPPEEVAGVYYLQRFVGVERDGFRDVRLLVSRGRVVAAMLRHAADWITNVKRGGRPLPVVVDAETRDLALAAAAAVGADFAGVDILHDAGGRPTILEVNSMPAWSGLQKVAPVDIAATLAADLIAAVAAKPARAVPA
jgi:tetrahydromethanopterin:alpha-L-glutamate ligase